MKKINESNSVWITSFDREIRRELRGQNACDDVCSTRLIYVLENIDKFMARFPNPKDAVRAMSSNAKNDYWRSESKQRGEGVRRGRKVGQLPSILSFSGQAVAVDIIDHRAIDPELQAIARDECNRILKGVKPVVAKGMVLTAVAGYDQSEAADRIGVSRGYLCKQVKQFKNEVKRGHARSSEDKWLEENGFSKYQKNQTVRQVLRLIRPHGPHFSPLRCCCFI